MASTTDRCGYVYTGETGRENCCYRTVWGDSDRCIWHTEAGDEDTKRIEELRETRAPPAVREQNGGNGPRELLDGAELTDVNFPPGADFAGVSLRDADMAEVTLRRASLSGADLSDTTLVDSDLRGADLTGAKCWEVELADGHLAGADLRGADLHESDCSDSVFRNANLQDANLEGAFFARADFFDATLTGTRSYGAVFSEARANEGTELDEFCVYDPHSDRSVPDTDRDGPPASADSVGEAAGPGNSTGESEISQLSKAEGTYQELESLCAENALLTPQSRYFVRRQDIHTTEHRRDGNWSRWIRARISRAVVLYGESPFRVLGAAGAVIVGSALLYPLGLLRSSGTGELVTYPPPTEPVALVSTLADSLYFSTLTFTTMTFGLFRPVGVGKSLAMLETGAGIVLMALLVFVFGRRATR
jgi:hypothetical protein